MADGSLRLLYVSPERLDRLSLDFQTTGLRPRLLVVDEAHCIAEWGHDFRPSYRLLSRARYRLGGPQAVALTGSATPGVRDEIARVLRLRDGFSLQVGSFDRPNLWFGAVEVRNEQHRLEALLQLLRGDDVMAIVYAATRGTTEAVARALCRAGHRAIPYHAGLTKARRADSLTDFLRDKVDVIVATCAFGMGIDKPDVRLVVHWSPPPTPEAYYQEAGRAGRDGDFARCVLLWRRSDTGLHRRQLDVTFPPKQLLEQLWSEPGKRVGVPKNVLESSERLRRELHPERGWIDWRPVQARRKQAETRIQAVEEYARGSGCRRARLVGYFGETLRSCRGCDRCGAMPLQRTRDPASHGPAGTSSSRSVRAEERVGWLPAWSLKFSFGWHSLHRQMPQRSRTCPEWARRFPRGWVVSYSVRWRTTARHSLRQRHRERSTVGVSHPLAGRCRPRDGRPGLHDPYQCRAAVHRRRRGRAIQPTSPAFEEWVLAPWQSSEQS